MSGVCFQVAHLHLSTKCIGGFSAFHLLGVRVCPSACFGFHVFVAFARRIGCNDGDWDGSSVRFADYFEDSAVDASDVVDVLLHVSVYHYFYPLETFLGDHVSYFHVLLMM